MSQIENRSVTIQSSYSIQGMTCEACAKTVSEKLKSISGVISVDVNLTDKKANITADRKIYLAEVRGVMSDSPKYSIEEFSPQIAIATVKASFFRTYKPLIIVFIFIILVSIAYQTSLGVFNYHLFMNHIMAGFFIGLSFFKFLDLKAFSESFSSYDPVARKWQNYGALYPFIELSLGLLFISGKFLLLANVTTILVLSLTTYGVYLRLQSKSKFQCACLGTAFNLPLSNVTIGENVVMISMALFGLVGM